MLLKIRKTDGYIQEALQRDGFSEYEIADEIGRQRRQRQSNFGDIIKPMTIALVIGAGVALGTLASGSVTEFACYFFGLLAASLILIVGGGVKVFRTLTSSLGMTGLVAFFRLKALMEAYDNMDEQDQQACSTGFILQGLGVLLLVAGGFLVDYLVGGPSR